MRSRSKHVEFFLIIYLYTGFLFLRRQLPRGEGASRATVRYWDDDWLSDFEGKKVARVTSVQEESKEMHSQNDYWKTSESLHHSLRVAKDDVLVRQLHLRPIIFWPLNDRCHNDQYKR